jgi:hypothetical protein
MVQHFKILVHHFKFLVRVLFYLKFEILVGVLQVQEALGQHFKLQVQEKVVFCRDRLGWKNTGTFFFISSCIEIGVQEKVVFCRHMLKKKCQHTATLQSIYFSTYLSIYLCVCLSIYTYKSCSEDTNAQKVSILRLCIEVNIPGH